MRFQGRGGFVKSASRRRQSGGHPVRGKADRGADGGGVSVSAVVRMARLVDWSRLVVGLGALLFISVVFLGGRASTGGPLMGSSETGLRGASGVRGGSDACPTVWCESKGTDLSFAVVADLDRQSKVDSGARHAEWKSFFKRGALKKSTDTGKWGITWEDDVLLTTHLGEDGRGLELSELLTWENKLWTFDDRSGVVFELDRKHQCIPRYVLMEGNGATTKGQKTEWATVKDGRMYVGSFGKPFTTDGEITSLNNLWISIIDASGGIEHVDWTSKYEKMQRDTDSVYPGYMIHEAIHFDQVNRLWYVLPRRVSHNAYDEKIDERMGSNLMLVYNEDFTSLMSKIAIGAKVPTHGWSSFKFVPYTKNRVILALRTMEIEDKETGAGEQASFVTVFDISGEVFLPETKIPGDHKFEGVEFL